MTDYGTIKYLNIMAQQYNCTVTLPLTASSTVFLKSFLHSRETIKEAIEYHACMKKKKDFFDPSLDKELTETAKNREMTRTEGLMQRD